MIFLQFLIFYVNKIYNHKIDFNNHIVNNIYYYYNNYTNYNNKKLQMRNKYNKFIK